MRGPPEPVNAAPRQEKPGSPELVQRLARVQIVGARGPTLVLCQLEQPPALGGGRAPPRREPLAQ